MNSLRSAVHHDHSRSEHAAIDKTRHGDERQVVEAQKCSRQWRARLSSFLRVGAVASAWLAASVTTAQATEFRDVSWVGGGRGEWSNAEHWRDAASDKAVVPDGATFRASIEGSAGGSVVLDQYAQLDSFYLGRHWTVVSDQFSRTLDTRSAELRGTLESVALNTRKKLYLGDVNYVPAYLINSHLRMSGEARGFGVIVGDTALTSFGTLTVDGFYTREPAFWPRPINPFTNLGRLVAAGTSSFTTMPFINGTGASVTARGVEWNMANGVTGGGTFSADSTGALRFGGPLAFDPAAVISAQGAVIFHGATGSIPPTGVRAASVAISQGQLNCTGDVVAEQSLQLCFDQSAVTDLLGGRLIIETGGVGSINVRPWAPYAPGRLFLKETEVVNRGSLLVTGECVSYSGSSGTLTNQGTVRTDGLSLLQWHVNNTGTFIVGTGTLTLTSNLVGPGSFILNEDATLEVGTADPNRPIRVFDGTRATLGGTLSVGSNVTIFGDVRTSHPITTYGPGVTFAGNVTAPSIDTRGIDRFAGDVVVERFTGGAVFDGPVTIDLLRGRPEFNSVGNRVRNLEVNYSCTVNGALEVDNAARVSGAFLGEGTTRLNGGLICPDLRKGGPGTLVIGGPVVLMGSESNGLIDMFGGVMVLRSDIETTLPNPRLYLSGTNSRLILETSLHLKAASLRGGLVTLGPRGLNVFRYAPWVPLPRLEGSIDLNDNMLVIDHTGGTTSPVLDYQLAAVSGYSGGAWNGAGVRSGVAAVTPGTGVGVVEAADIFSAFPADFEGESVDATTLLVRYTLLGDADLNRLVDIDDFGLMARWFNVPGFRTWVNGDFNYNFGVSTDDFALLAANFNQQLGVLTAQRPATVPEPSIVSLFTIASLPPFISRSLKRGHGRV